MRMRQRPRARGLRILERILLGNPKFAHGRVITRHIVQSRIFIEKRHIGAGNQWTQ